MLNPCVTNHHEGCKGQRVRRANTKDGGVIDIHELCDCDCHHTLHPVRCLRCNTSGTAFYAGYCTDTELCAQNLETALAQDVTMQKLRSSKEHGRNARAAAGDTPSTAKPAPKQKTGSCEHCGQPTKGGRFVAGHDAKLKGDLKRAAEAGDLDALVELIVRNWPVKNVKVDIEFMHRAELESTTRGLTWLSQRNEERTS